MKSPKEANKYILNGDKYRLIPSYLDRPAFYSMIDKTENRNLDDVRNSTEVITGTAAELCFHTVT